MNRMLKMKLRERGNVIGTSAQLEELLATDTDLLYSLTPSEIQFSASLHHHIHLRHSPSTSHVDDVRQASSTAILTFESLFYPRLTPSPRNSNLTLFHLSCHHILHPRTTSGIVSLSFPLSVLSSMYILFLDFLSVPFVPFRRFPSLNWSMLK